MDKRYHEYVAVNRMSCYDEKKYYKVNWKQKRLFLNKIYGDYNPNKTDKR